MNDMGTGIVNRI